MNLYDKAHELARAIRESDQYKRYESVKKEVFASESDKRMITDFKKMQFEAQAALFSGQEPSADLMDKLRKLGEILQLNPKITEYFAAEYAMQTVAADVYKIVSDACDLETPALQE